MKYREVAKRLIELGCVEVPRKGGGSHRKWWNPAANLGTVVPDWGPKDLKFGTIRAAVKQLGLEWNRFERGDSA